MPIINLNNNSALTDVAKNYTEQIKQRGISQGRQWKEWGDQWVKEWTTDESKGDTKSFTFHNGQIYFPIWKSESEYTGEKIDKQAEQYTNPNSDYYKSINKEITSAVNSAYSPDSLLALTVAMGGSPTQAQEQIKALQNRVAPTVSGLMNQYYLGASEQATSLLGMSMNNAQFQEQLRKQMEQYKDAQRNAWLNSLLSFGAKVAGTAAGGGFGGKVNPGDNISSGYTAQDYMNGVKIY